MPHPLPASETCVICLHRPGPSLRQHFGGLRRILYPNTPAMGGLTALSVATAHGQLIVQPDKLRTPMCTSCLETYLYRYDGDSPELTERDLLAMRARCYQDARSEAGRMAAVVPGLDAYRDLPPPKFP